MPGSDGRGIRFPGPCALDTGQRSVSVDTTAIRDGAHTLTPIFTDAAGNVVFGNTFPIVVHNAPTNTARPALGGTAQVGQELSASNGQWEGSPAFAYKWLRCQADVADKSEAGCTEISGATQAQYTATAADLGKRLVAKVTATNAAGSDVALSAASAQVVAAKGGDGPGGGGNPPQTKLAKHPRRNTALRKARFTFSSDQPGSHFQCKLDKAPFRSCRSPFTRKVKRGRHTLQVRAVNAAGTSDPTPAKFSWRVF